MGEQSLDTGCPQDTVMLVLFVGGSFVCLLISVTGPYLSGDVAPEDCAPVDREAEYRQVEAMIKDRFIFWRNVLFRFLRTSLD